jgi:enoyl-CoA hydratase/carnithine racemase
MNAFQDITYTTKDWVATVTICRPGSYNAYSARTLREMARAFRAASEDDAVAVIVLTGEGDQAFSTGGDVKEYADVHTKRPHEYWKYMRAFADAIEGLTQSGKPTIARVNGMAVGGGNEFNLACDLSIAADHARFRQVGVQVGSVAAGGATQWLALTIGEKRARQMLMTCEWVDAKTALEWGLVNEVVPLSELDAAVARLAAKLIDTFPECMRYTKAQANFLKDFVWSSTLSHAQDWLSVHFGSVEPYEGMTAFAQKRPAGRVALREKARDGGSGAFLWGPYTQLCPECGAAGLPAAFTHCGRCGHALTPIAEPAHAGR